jgi:MFS family permease
MAGGVLFAALAQKMSQRTWLVGATGLYAAALFGLSFLQPGSVLAILVGFVAGLMLSVMFAVPFTAFYSRTPQKLLGRVGSVGAAMGSLMGAIASLGFGWLINSVSARQAVLGCALLMGVIALAGALMPFMRLLDKQPEAAAEASPAPVATEPALT